MNKQNVTPLGRKIVAAILGTTLLALALSFTLNVFPMIYSYRQDAADRAQALADLMATSLVAAIDFDDADAAKEDLASLSLVPSVTGAAVYVKGDAPFALYGVAPRPVPANKSTVLTAISGLVVVQPIPTEAGSTLVIAVSLDGQWGVVQGYLLVGAAIFLGVFLFSFKVAGFFRRRLGDPLRELTAVVYEISQGRDYSRRVEYESDDEVGVLVAEFNSMLGKIEQRDVRLSRYHESLERKVEERTLQLQANQQELMRNNRLLLGEVQRRAKAEMIREEVERINRHDLKSSLSLVIGYPELLLKEGGLTSGQEQKVKRIRAAGYRMLDMIRNHLDMFKMEKGIYSLSRQQVDLVEVICGLEEEFTPQLSSAQVALGVELNGQEVVGDEEFMVCGEMQLVRVMLRNLIQNGIEASHPGDKVTVHLCDARKKQLSVSNPAPVPQEVRERIFDKYVTYGKENGTGLGTYIAALIARTHGANICMKTERELGTIMTISFREECENKQLSC